MNQSIVGQLILKDCRLFRVPILVNTLAGAAALVLVQVGGEIPVVVGAVLFFITLILVGHMLPMAGIVNERKNHNLTFVMSLPGSFFQYTTAKLIATVGMFFIPWAALVASAVVLIEVRAMLPHGIIPFTLILALAPFVGMSLVTGAALVGESEGWGIAANVFCNSAYGLFWYFLARNPVLMNHARGPSPVWDSTTLNILGGEFVSIVLILGLTYFLQSRKRDFV
ncbi:MAG TPA: hypothetical protein VMB03_30310 [Bryobacteraceae bacterium]|nr:hypothetical protein [Bryobacteraceae bacterium]